MYSIGFDNERYLRMQAEHIRKRIGQFGNKLYLEFGGKLFDDNHAARVLPGFNPCGKIQLLKTLAHMTEIIMVINASDIEKNRIQGDHGITYGDDLQRLIDAFRAEGLFVSSVVIAIYAQQEAADQFKRQLEQKGIKVYLHYHIPGYPTNPSFILSDEGFGKNEFVETTQPLVVVTAPGASSGKMATCFSQLYHEHKRGIQAGYAKFETFPIWNLPLNHPINLAYEAATTDVKDVNVIDPFHLEAYGTSAVNYNRDVEGFPVLNDMLMQIWGQSPYQSPTDMGVNMVGHCISDDEVCRHASQQEIIRRYYAALCDLRRNDIDTGEIAMLELIMTKAGTGVDNRRVIAAALAKEQASGTPSLAIELPNGEIVTGRTSELLGAASAALLNALKVLGDLDDSVKIISRDMIVPIHRLKRDFLGSRNPRLHTDEVLVALSIGTVKNSDAEVIFQQLPNLRNSEAHSTVLLSQVDINVFRKLGVNVTSEPRYESNNMYHKR